MEASAHQHEPRWHAAVFTLAAIALYVTLPNRVAFGPLWLMPLLVSAMLVPLLLISPVRREETRFQRWLSIALIATLNVFNLATLVELVATLLGTKRHLGGSELLIAGVQIWLTNIIVFGLWFWEIDGDGPAQRAHVSGLTPRSDFVFPQMSLPEDLRNPEWRTKVVDYMYLAFTNATAFSPTDTYPLTRRAKALMTVEGFTSLVTIAIIAGRSVNILNGG